ncbi:hypothetical protein EXS65_01410 [Candidatus Peribacteria bacterium]|nr:hypothetical protein [Candidatus Peribacteria bacterium]
MQLQCAEIAEQAFLQKVDLKRLYTEMIEGVALELHSVRIGGGMLATEPEVTALAKKIKTLGFSGLSEGQWRKVLGVGGGTSPTILDHLESLIRSFGRYCNISDAAEVRMSIEALKTINRNFSGVDIDAFLQSLAETAVNQQLDASGIGMIEMQRLNSNIDVDLLVESKKIVQMTREKIDMLMKA